jgi:hypothetical protein
MMDDEQLLHACVRERSEAAFGELVARHIDFVYSTALRVVNGTNKGPFAWQSVNRHPSSGPPENHTTA